MNFSRWQTLHLLFGGHYAGVISGEQIEYMLEHFSRCPPSKEADARGCEYYLIRAFGVNMGYAAVKPNNPQGKMFLSKIYLLEEYRGKGYARDVVNEVREMARSLRLPIWRSLLPKIMFPLLRPMSILVLEIRRIFAKRSAAAL